MAAEKLTKHRLAQIVITLVLLLIAFFWRTITYTEINTVICNPQPNCSLFVNNQKITVTKDDKKNGVIIVYPVQSDWIINYDGDISKNDQNLVLSPKGNNLHTSTYFIINNSIKIQIEN